MTRIHQDFYKDKRYVPLGTSRVVVYMHTRHKQDQYRAMAKKKTSKKTRKISPKSQRIVLGGTIVAALGVLAVMVLVLPTRDSQPVGVGADGFSAFVDRGKDLGVTNIASKETVDRALGNNAKSVENVEKSDVFNLNGALGQTATYPITLPDDSKGTVTIDQWNYNSKDAFDQANVFKGTGVAGTIDGREVRYVPAISLGGERTYTLLTTEGTTVYRFIMTQPSDNIQIREFKAQDILKAIIAKSNL